MIHCFFLMSRHGRSRLTKWYTHSMSQREKQKFLKQLNILVLTRKPKIQYKVIYKRFASLYFIAVVDREDNQLLVLELFQNFVEVLDKHFGNVCELDLIFKFHQTYFLLDQMIIAGYVQQKDTKVVLNNLDQIVKLKLVNDKT